jgi:hypothetical protein
MRSAEGRPSLEESGSWPRVVEDTEALGQQTNPPCHQALGTGTNWAVLSSWGPFLSIPVGRAKWWLPPWGDGWPMAANLARLRERNFL